MPKTIKLKQPIEGHVDDGNGGTKIGFISQIVLRDPKYADLMALGEPSAYARSSEGMLFTTEREEIMQAYIERLMIEPIDRSLLQQVSLADAIQLKDAVYDFFQDAKRVLSPPSSKD